MSMGWDQKMGAVYVLTMTTSMGIMNLEAPSMAVGCQGLHWRNWPKKTWQRAVPDCCSMLLLVLLKTVYITSVNSYSSLGCNFKLI